MSDIRFISSGIGGGKSRLACSFIADELIRTERMIITNVPLCLRNPPSTHISWADWVHQYASDRDIDINRRIFCLTEQQTGSFWEYYPFGELSLMDMPNASLVMNQDDKYTCCRGFRLGERPHPKEKGIRVTDFDPLLNNPKFHGAYWLIDEAHIHFSSRHLYKDSSASARAEHFMSQVRKARGDIDFFTQHPEKVDKNFRRNATQWIEVQNRSKIRMFMGVQMKESFAWHAWTQNDMPQRRQTPDFSGTFTLKERDLHKTYFTMAGTGIKGGLTPETSRFKGLHWSVWILPVVGVFLAVLAIVIIVPKVIRKGSAAFVNASVGAVTAGVGDSNLGKTVKQAAMPAAIPPAMPPPPVMAPPLVLPPTIHAPPQFRLPDASQGLVANDSVYCTGWAPLADATNVIVYLSDGREADSRNEGDVQAVGKRRVKVFGQTFVIKQNQSNE